MHELVVEARGVRRTIIPGLDDLVIPMSPTRLVTIEVEVLDSPVVASSGGGTWPPLLEVRWGDGRWLHALMRAAGPSPPPTLEVADVLSDLPRVPVDTRSFAVRVPMPIGRSDVGVAGPCGFAARTVHVPAGSEPIPTVRIELSCRAGTLEIGGAHVEGSVTLAFGDLTVGVYRVLPIQGVEMTGLPPGRYRLVGSPPCEREVEIVPGRRTTLELREQDQCLIRPSDGPR